LVDQKVLGLLLVLSYNPCSIRGEFMADKRGDERVLVSAAVLLDNGRVLLAQRPPGDPLAGRWELPGGKVKENETPEACLKRELFEECGISVWVGRKYAASGYTYPHATVTLLAYLIEAWQGELQAHFHAQLRWFALADVTHLELAPADVPILTRLRREFS
jgi:mutator protein MutT